MFAVSGSRYAAHRACSWCGRGCASRGALARHIREHHVGRWMKLAHTLPAFCDGREGLEDTTPGPAPPQGNTVKTDSVIIHAGLLDFRVTEAPAIVLDALVDIVTGRPVALAEVHALPFLSLASRDAIDPAGTDAPAPTVALLLQLSAHGGPTPIHVALFEAALQEFESRSSERCFIIVTGSTTTCRKVAFVEATHRAANSSSVVVLYAPDAASVSQAHLLNGFLQGGGHITTLVVPGGYDFSSTPAAVLATAAHKSASVFALGDPVNDAVLYDELTPVPPELLLRVRTAAVLKTPLREFTTQRRMDAIRRLFVRWMQGARRG